MFCFRTAGHRKPLQDSGGALSIVQDKFRLLSFLTGRENGHRVACGCGGRL